jgi:hypothetical protein
MPNVASTLGSPSLLHSPLLASITNNHEASISKVANNNESMLLKVVACRETKY